MLYRTAYILSFLCFAFLSTLFALLAIEAFPSLITGEIFATGYWESRLEAYSSLAMLYGTVIVTGTALVIAIPIGVGAAIFISECLHGRLRGAAKVILELMAGIPSVVYGLLGVAFLLPFMEDFVVSWGGVTGDSLITAGMLLAIMILPTIITFSDDALRCVPRSIREESYGLGLSKLQVIGYAVMPRARAGIIASILLALGRAIGETVAIYLVIGRTDQPFYWTKISFEDLVKTGQTITTKLGGSEIAIAYGDTNHWQALMSLALFLWFAVAIITNISRRLSKGGM